MTQEEVSERTGIDRSTLYRLESAQQRPQRSTLIQLLDLYRAEDPRRGELLTLLREAGQRGWLQQYRSELPDVYSDYIGFEDEARSISNYESLFIPGLLQTEDYVRALIHGTLPYAGGEEIENRVSARMAAVRRQVGTREVMHAQLDRLREAATRPNVTIQVIPFDAGAHPGMHGSFVVLEFSDAADLSIVYTESAAGGLFLEEEVEVRRYILMFEYLRAAALRPEATATVLAAIAAET